MPISPSSLPVQVSQGVADPDLLQRAERTLSKMEQRLSALAEERRKASVASAQKVTAVAAAVAPAKTAPKASEAKAGGGFWGMMSAFIGGGGSGGSGGTSVPGKAVAAEGSLPATQSAPPSSSAVPSPVRASATDAGPGGDEDKSAVFRLGSFAARLAVGMASSLREDAEKMIRGIEAEQEAKVRLMVQGAPRGFDFDLNPSRIFQWCFLNMVELIVSSRNTKNQCLKPRPALTIGQVFQRANEAAFMALLRDRIPAITTLTTYEQIVESSGSDPRYGLRGLYSIIRR